MERLATLYREDSVESPTVSQKLPTRVLGIGELVNKVPSQTLPHVEIRIPAIQLWRSAVRGLRGVGDVVLSVTGSINRMGPGEVQSARKTMPVVDPVGGLQRIVVGLGSTLLPIDIVVGIK